MTEEFNPYQTPQTADHEVQTDKRSESRVTIFDWGIAFLLGGVSSCAAFVAVFIGTATSLMASNFDELVPYDEGHAQFGLLLCCLLSLATGYSAGANYLLQRFSRASGLAKTQGNANELPSSGLKTFLGKTIVLDKLLTGCFTGLFSALVLAPLVCFLLGMLSRTLRLSQDQSYWAMLSTFIGSMVVGLLIGWYRWRRVSTLSLIHI